jgi:hypothetical protein
VLDDIVDDSFSDDRVQGTLPPLASTQDASNCAEIVLLGFLPLSYGRKMRRLLASSLDIQLFLTYLVYTSRAAFVNSYLQVYKNP